MGLSFRFREKKTVKQHGHCSAFCGRFARNRSQLFTLPSQNVICKVIMIASYWTSTHRIKIKHRVYTKNKITYVCFWNRLSLLNSVISKRNWIFDTRSSLLLLCRQFPLCKTYHRLCSHFSWVGIIVFYTETYCTTVSVHNISTKTRCDGNETRVTEMRKTVTPLWRWGRRTCLFHKHNNTYSDISLIGIWRL